MTTKSKIITICEFINFIEWKIINNVLHLKIWCNSFSKLKNPWTSINRILYTTSQRLNHMVSPRPIRNSQFSCTDRAICTISHLIHGNHKRLYKVVVEKVVITACRGCSKVTKIIVTLRFYHNLLLVFLLFILLLKQKKFDNINNINKYQYL